MPYGFGDRMRLESPLLRRSAIDAALMRLWTFEPALLQPIDIGTPVPDRRLNEVRIPSRVEIACKRFRLTFASAFEAAHRHLHLDLVAPDLLCHRMQRLMNIADKMHGEFQGFLFAARSWSTAQVFLQALEFSDDAVAVGARRTFGFRIVDRDVDRDVDEMPSL